MGQKRWLKSQGLEMYGAIQCMVEWKTAEGYTFNHTLLVNWIDPENSSAVSDQQIKFVGTRECYEGDQKERGVSILLDGHTLEEQNPDFCRAYSTEDGYFAGEGYGIDSITCFLKDVPSILSGRSIPQDYEGKSPTFLGSFVSTAVIESTAKSLSDQSAWKTINLM